MESLPKQFVLAMRTLFDIMDDKHTGYVKLTDIENRWRDDRTKGLPRGVVQSLHKVASHDGLLTFDRFCTGLKICILRNQVESASKQVDAYSDDVEKTVTNENLTVSSRRPPSAPILDIDETPSNKAKRSWADVTLPQSMTQHRTTSMPILISRKDAQVLPHSQLTPTSENTETLSAVFAPGPPKPPRSDKNSQDRKALMSLSCKSDDETGFGDENMNDTNKRDIMKSKDGRGHGDGRPNVELSTALRKIPRRREPRRHTLHNGVDYNLLKRMKQMEQEKDILLQGLASVEEAREWYLKELAEVQDKMRYAGRMGAYVEPWSEAHQERLELLRARILEVNRQLGALATGWRRGPLSLHMNLALPMTSFTGNNQGSNHAVLRTENRTLIEEVNRKNETISVLEREKSSLIRELILQRNRTKITD